jgi:predicted transcriptional regulator
MGIWAMRTRLRYYIQTLESAELHKHSNKGRIVAYRQAQQLREKLQIKINQLSKQNEF